MLWFGRIAPLAARKGVQVMRAGSGPSRGERSTGGRTSYLVIGCGVVALSVLGGINPVWAEQSSPKPQADAFVDAAFNSKKVVDQEKTGAVAERLSEAAFGDSGLGLAGLKINSDNLHIDLWWKGDIPPNVQQVIDDSADGVTIATHPAPRSRAQLMKAADRVLPELPTIGGGRLLEGRATVNFVSVLPDGSGLKVKAETKGLPGGSAERAELVRVAAARVAGVPVPLVELDAQVAPTDRQNDLAPWWAGGAMKRNRADGKIGNCSVGFNVDRNSDGTDMLLSAAHCDDDGGNWNWYDGTLVDRLAYGSATSFLRSGRDSMLVDPIGDTAGYVFTGAWNQSAFKKVAGTAANFMHEEVCTSGAVSGQHCSLRITDDVAYWSFGGYRYGPGSVAVASTSGGTAVAGGDSGGPVYALRSDGRVTARGIISAGGTQVVCPSTSVPTDCYNQVAYYPIRPLQTAWGVTVKTLQ